MRYLYLILLVIIGLFWFFPKIMTILLILFLVLVVFYFIGVASETNKRKCPKCGSQDIFLLKDVRSPFSYSKALLGASLYGKKGASLGLLGNKEKGGWVCKSCGHRFLK